ncbi:MAG TPA: hypothetical protein VFV78_10995 [Vicinamibacterales bacterium]|nr:hypothetical protein [Vicinamibacterales bacterium]
MRRSLVLAVLLSSAIGVSAQQATPPPTPPPTPPATSPPATTPPSTATPSTRPPAAPTPTTRPGVARAPRTSAPTAPAPSGERVASSATPQTAPTRTTPQPARPGERGEPTPAASWQNVRLDVKISDTVNPDGGKTVTFVCVDGHSGQVRSQSGDGLINIDARPTVRGDGRILVQLTIEYRPELTAQQTQQSGSSRVAGFSESLSVVVTDGKPMVASQSADPKSDRKVSVEITAAVQPIR